MLNLDFITVIVSFDITLLYNSVICCLFEENLFEEKLNHII